MSTENDVLTVENIMPQLEPLLSDAARAVFATARPGFTPNCFSFGLRCLRTEREQLYPEFARRISEVIARLDGRDHLMAAVDHTIQLQPRVVAVLSPPLMVPLVNDQALLVAYVFVDGTPSGVEGAQWLNGLLHDLLAVLPEGINLRDLPLTRCFE